MSDDVYKKQLESFGIESVRAITTEDDKKKNQEYRQLYLNVVKNLMKDMAGRQWLYSKLDMCRVFTAPFVAGKPDATAFMCGMQAFGQSLLDDIMQASPENFWIMVQEADARKRGTEIK